MNIIKWFGIMQLRSVCSGTRRKKRFKGFIFLEGPRNPEHGQGFAGRILEVSKAKYILWKCTSYMPVRLGDVNLLLWY